MTKKEIAMCNSIIHTASVGAGVVGAGLAQFPCSDNVILTPIQLTMAVSLAKVFGHDLSKGAAKAAVASAIAAKVGRAASQVAAGLLPVAGNVINACTAASLTEGIGWIMAKEFEKRGVTDETE